MVFVSTECFRGTSTIAIIQDLIRYDIHAVELTGGMYSETLKKDLWPYKEQCCMQVHNYFPPPKEPFVLNLASLDQDITAASMDHIKKAMRWAIELDRPVYSFHAGYLFDPKPEELGTRIRNRAFCDREKCLNLFIERVNDLASIAEEDGIRLLIENNVLSSGNYEEFGRDPFLMTTPWEAEWVMRNTSENVNLLVDVAHLKVSARSMNFDSLVMFHRCDPWIHAYHLSDNDGLSDNNGVVREDSWFWPHIKHGLDYYSLEVCNISLQDMKRQLSLVEGKIA